jgi:hypothetical protein
LSSGDVDAVLPSKIFVVENGLIEAGVQDADQTIG